jgi:hypothetical protein
MLTPCLLLFRGEHQWGGVLERLRGILRHVDPLIIMHVEAEEGATHF